MTNTELIKELQKFPEDTIVLITDGFKCNFYNGNYIVGSYEKYIDIGIGDCEEFSDTQE